MDRIGLENITRLWISLWNAPLDRELFDRLHGDDFIDCGAAGREPTKAAYLRSLEEFIAAFPDVTTSVDDMVIEPETGKVAVRWRAEGTNRACYQGVGPTNMETSVTGIEIIEIKGGQVYRRWGEWDINEHLSKSGRFAA
ncbi:MAG: ester cyclase [Anaerolineaceae bacterium]